MRFHEINEAIENRPRNLPLFLKNRVKDLVAIKQEIQEATAIIEKNNTRDGEKMLDMWLSYDENFWDGGSNILYNNLLYTKEYFLERNVPIDRLIDNIKAYLQFGKNHWKYILGTFSYMEPFLELSNFENAEAGAVKYGYKEGDPDNLQDEEYVQAMGLLKGFRMMKHAIDSAKKVFELIKRKLTVIDKILGSSYHGNYRPDHEEQETLYHATAFCNEILETGFSSEKPVERVGLGNFGEQTTISFTHDIEIARNIMRCFKDIWAIAHGELTARTIIRWGQAEGIEERLAKQHGGHPGFDWVKTPEDVVMLYSYYLAHSKIRVNPVFIGVKRLVEIMRDREQKDIGVLACEVRLEQTDEYLLGESEFRLPADRVQSIKRVF
jgi:hypothetical protein